jgi:hypothetical protein
MARPRAGRRDVGQVLVGRPVCAQRPGRQGQVLHDLVGALDLEAFLLEFVHQHPQQGVVALARRGDHAGQHHQAAQVGHQAGEVGPATHCRPGRRTAAGALQRLHALADLGEPTSAPA